MRQLLTRNLGWKLLSLLIAIALWLAVAREPELATSLSVPIQFKNIPEDLDIGSEVPDRIHLEIRGPSGRLTRDNLANVAMVLDLSDARLGERTYTVRDLNFNLPAGVSFYHAVPSQITLRFERLMSREVPVYPRFSKLPPEGYRIKSTPSPQPKMVRIRGPEERVKRIDQVMTDPIDLSAAVGEQEFRTHVNVGDPQVRLEVPTVITLKVTLEKIAPKAAQ